MWRAGIHVSERSRVAQTIDVIARVAFDREGRRYTAGEWLSVSPIDAVVLRRKGTIRLTDSNDFPPEEDPADRFNEYNPTTPPAPTAGTYQTKVETPAGPPIRKRSRRKYQRKDLVAERA